MYDGKERIREWDNSKRAGFALRCSSLLRSHGAVLKLTDAFEVHPLLDFLALQVRSDINDTFDSSQLIAP